MFKAILFVLASFFVSYTHAIVGGELIDITKRPFQVSIYNGGGFCGGTLLNNKWILTTAECTSGVM